MGTTGTAREIDNQELLQQILNNTNVIAVKLFGSCDADNENTTGRLPKVESAVSAATLRIEALEKKLIWYAGIASSVLWLVEHLIKKIPL